MKIEISVEIEIADITIDAEYLIGRPVDIPTRFGVVTGEVVDVQEAEVEAKST